MCVPPLLPHISRLPGPTKEFLDLIAQYSDPREVTIVLNEEFGRLAEQSDPYVVSDGESDSEAVELDWTKAFPELEQILDMYATGKPYRVLHADRSHPEAEEPAQHPHPSRTSRRPCAPLQGHPWHCAPGHGHGDVTLAADTDLQPG